MDWNIRKLTCIQLIRQLKPFYETTTLKDGWVRTMRAALGMTTTQLAKKCNVNKQRILRIEQDEVSGHTTLASLEKVADKLECKLVYAFVPKQDLLTLIEQQAEKKAIEQLSRITHSMKLEDQEVIGQMQKEQLGLLKEDLMKNNIKSLWD